MVICGTHLFDVNDLKYVFQNESRELVLNAIFNAPYEFIELVADKGVDSIPEAKRDFLNPVISGVLNASEKGQSEKFVKNEYCNIRNALMLYFENRIDGTSKSLKKFDPKGFSVALLCLFLLDCIDIPVKFDEICGYIESIDTILEDAKKEETNGSIEKAHDLYTKCAELGNVEAQRYLGICYENGDCGFEKDQTEAIKWYEKAVDNDDAEAKYLLACCYSVGSGVKLDKRKSASLLIESGEQGCTDAQYMLYSVYQTGDGVQKNHKEAIKWLKKSAENGDPDRQYLLGHKYCSGDELQQDYSEGNVWLRKSAHQGNKEAQCELGINYFEGLGVDQDYFEAFKFFQLSSEQGNVTAQYNLGVCYENGYGVERDYFEALKFYQLASEFNEIAKEALEKIQGLIAMNSDFVIYNGRLGRYKGCKSDVVVPPYVKEILSSAFKDHSEIVTVSLPDGIKIIGKNAFSGCINLVKINIPDSVEFIGRNVFASCRYLRTLELPRKFKDNNDVDLRKSVSFSIRKITFR